jgi:hypothetical protein
MTYLEELKMTLSSHKEMLGLLEKRIELLSYNTYGSGEEYAQNEDKITIIRTKGEINTLKAIIYEKEKYFEKYAKQFEVEKAEMELNFDNLVKQVKIKRLKDDKLDAIMKNVDMEKVNSSVETKLGFYKTMKSFISDKK